MLVRRLTTAESKIEEVGAGFDVMWEHGKDQDEKLEEVGFQVLTLMGQWAAKSCGVTASETVSAVGSMTGDEGAAYADNQTGVPIQAFEGEEFLNFKSWVII